MVCRLKFESKITRMIAKCRNVPENAEASLLRWAKFLSGPPRLTHQYAYFITYNKTKMGNWMQRVRLIVRSKLFTSNEKQSEKQSVSYQSGSALPLQAGVYTPAKPLSSRSCLSLSSFHRGQLDTHKKARIIICLTPRLLTEVGQLSSDPASEALVVVVVVATTLTAVALAASSSASSSTISGRGVGISRGRVSVAAVLATALAPVASLSLTSVVVGVSGRVAVVTGVVVVVGSSARSRLSGIEGGGLDGRLLDDGVRDVEYLLDARVSGLALGASLLLVGGDGGGQVLLVLGDLLVDTVEGLCRGDLGGDVGLRGGTGLLNGEASAEGAGQGVVSASDCADVAS